MVFSDDLFVQWGCGWQFTKVAHGRRMYTDSGLGKKRPITTLLLVVAHIFWCSERSRGGLGLSYGSWEYMVVVRDDMSKSEGLCGRVRVGVEFRWNKAWRSTLAWYSTKDMKILKNMSPSTSRAQRANLWFVALINVYATILTLEVLVRFELWIGLLRVYQMLSVIA